MRKTARQITAQVATEAVASDIVNYDPETVFAVYLEARDQSVAPLYVDMLNVGEVEWNGVRALVYGPACHLPEGHDGLGYAAGSTFLFSPEDFGA